MNFKRISFPCLSSILLCLSLVTACGGETKQAQCQKIGNIINGLGAVNSSDLGVMAKLGASAANDLEDLELGDKKLSDLRSQLSTSLKAASESTSKLVEFAGPDGSLDDSPEVEVFIAQADEDSRAFTSTIDEIQTYCNE